MPLNIRPFIYVSVAILSLMLSACNSGDSENSETSKDVPETVSDFQNILRKGKLTVLVENSSTSYFIYKGKKMGFEYEILQEFAKEIGVELEVKIVSNLDNLIPMLDNEEGDLIACNYTVTRERKELIDFSVPFIHSAQVLVQKKPDGWDQMKPEELEKKIINDATELSHKKVSVWLNSSYYQRLMNLQDEIGDSIFIQPVNGLVGSEELIEMVSEGIIDYTVVEENIGKVNQRFYDNIDIGTQISVKQKIAFGLRKKSGLLKAKLDKWLTKFLDSRLYSYIYRKYFEIGTIHISASEKATLLKGGKISTYDEIFKEAQKIHGTDWILLASVAYQESKFNPYIESFGGAYGMMQFMPNTGPYYGVFPDSPPEVQIMGGMKKLTADIKFWKEIPDKVQREKFALASYNAGGGHIKDAQRLAKKHGLNHLVWDENVELMLLNLSKQEYYRDEVVKNGSMRGTTTYNYVRNVYQRYLDWKSAYH